MFKCDVCKNFYKNKTGLKIHQSRNPEKSCVFKCLKCYKTFKNKNGLKKHLTSARCNRKYKCDTCMMLFNKYFNYERHMEKHPSIEKQDQIIEKESEQIEEILNKLPVNPTGQNVNIINVTQNINNVTKVKNKVNNKINNNRLSFKHTRPRMFDFDYIGDEELKKLSVYNEQFSEELADKYMYEEREFKNTHKKETYLLFEKQNLELEGFRILFTELQKNPRNRNTRIQKMKSGKCYIYTDGGWKEVHLQKTITRICNKLCNFLYDRDTSVNEFINLVIGSQPKRMMTLRKHIEKCIIDINDDFNEILKNIDQNDENAPRLVLNFGEPDDSEFVEKNEN